MRSSVKVTVIMAFGLSFLLCITGFAGAGEGLANPWDEYDLGGESVRIGGHVIPFYWDMPLTEELDEGRAMAHKEWVEEAFNCTIEILDIPYADITDSIITGILIGETEADVYIHQNVHVETELAPEGVLYPLDDVLDAAYYDKVPSLYRNVLPTYDRVSGTAYMFQVGPPQPSEARGIIWNKSLFEREGLPSLYDIYEGGEWTWDAFREIAIQATRDTSGDGEIDQWGVASRPWGAYMRGDAPIGWHSLIPWVYTNSGSLTRLEDGRRVFSLDEEEALEAMEFWQELDDAGVVNAWEPIWNESVAMDFDLPANAFWVRDAFQEMDDDWGVVPLPMGPRADEHASVQRLIWTAMLPITLDKDPRAVIEVYNALYRITDDYYGDAHPEFRNFTWTEAMLDEFTLVTRDRESIEHYRWIAKNAQLIRFLNMAEVLDGLDVAIWDAMAGVRSPSAAMSEIAPAAQAWLDDVLSQ